MTPERLEDLREAHQRGMSIHAYHALADELLAALGATRIALDNAQAALHRIHDRPDMPASIRTITEHALRNERWDDTVEPGGFVCAICGQPSESEPCPQHGHTGQPWCCDDCKTSWGANDAPSR